ncbi:MAG: hypothetical protein R2865_11340 [Deinococcales bacterium]
MVDVQGDGVAARAPPQLDSTQDHLRRKIATGDIIHGSWCALLNKAPAGKGATTGKAL